MIPLSCSNCWYNGLQYGSLGLSVGYCAEHQVVLRRSDETTCRRHLRKDLLLENARHQNVHHTRSFPADEVVPLRGSAGKTRSAYVEEATDSLATDSVGGIVAEYGDLGTKIESLAQLRRVPGARAEVGLMSLGRAYVNRCIVRGGEWTSGLHLIWWVRERLGDEPEVAATDLRYQAPTALKRQIDLVRWSVVMLRLTFVSDIGTHSRSDPRHGTRKISRLRTLAERAAAETQTTSFAKLMKWVKREGIPAFDTALSKTAYRRFASALRQQDDP